MYCFCRKWIWTFKYWFKTGNLETSLKGHVGKTKEIHENCSVEISYCEECGKQMINWTHGKFSDQHKNMMYEKGNCGCLNSQ